MTINITSIELKSPFKFFPLSIYALRVVRQLNANSGCVKFRKKGFGTIHYTMTLWNNLDEMRDFAKSGAHLEAMKKSAQISKVIRTLNLEADELPNWKIATTMLQEQGKSITY